MIFGMTYYQICMYFLLYSFGGWVVEVLFFALTKGRVVNRGFLSGPVCPVYGFGMLAVLAAGNLLSQSGSASRLNSFELFFFGMLLATAVELVAGWLLHTLFHARWWDYSDKPLNFHGYICLEFSVIWGLAILLVVKVVHPALSRNTAGAIPEEIGWPIMAVLGAIYLADVIVTVLTVLKLDRELEELDRIRTAMRQPSNRLSENIATNAISTAQKIQEREVQAALARAEMKNYAAGLREGSDLLKVEVKAELEKRAEELRKEFTERAGKRILQAFPTIRNARHEDLLEELKQAVLERRNRASGE